MIPDFFIPFITIGLAEFGDKTQIAILALTTRTKNHLILLTGIMLAFIITDGLAILVGNYITRLVPLYYIRIASGVLFIFFGIITILSRDKDETTGELKNPFISGFGIILLSEMGDKTQIASGIFATKYQPLLVFAGVIIVLAILSLLAISFGILIKKMVHRRLISFVTAGIFFIIGILIFLDL